MQPDGPTFLLTDPGPEVTTALKALRARLRELDYGSTATLPLPGSPLDVLQDPVNLARAVRGASNTFYPSGAAALYRTARRRRAPALVGLHELLLLGHKQSTTDVRQWLGEQLLDELLSVGALSRHEGGLRADVLVAPHGGEVYLSDPIRLQDHPDYCYLGRSTFTVPDFVAARSDLPSSGRLLDLGCGAGAAAVAAAGRFDDVVGADVVERCLRFGRLNAALQDKPVTFVLSDVLDGVDGTFDLIVCNTPCVWSDSEAGAPRTYVAGGGTTGSSCPRGCCGSRWPGSVREAPWSRWSWHRSGPARPTCPPRWTGWAPGWRAGWTSSPTRCSRSSSCGRRRSTASTG